MYVLCHAAIRSLSQVSSLPRSTKGAIDNIQANGCGCVSKLYS